MSRTYLSPKKIGNFWQEEISTQKNPARGVGDEKEREKGRHSSGKKTKATLQLENRELSE